MEQQTQHTPGTDEREELMLILKMAEAAVSDPRHKSTFRRSRDRIEQLERENAELLAAVKQADTALTDWVRSHAPELCDAGRVRHTRERICANGGTLAYIANVRAAIAEALAKAGAA